jgi:mono/diheme cytochrome c family protein
MKHCRTIALLTLFLVAGPAQAAVAEDAEEKIDFVKQIKPILEESCIKCHGPNRAEGSLRMHTREATMKGGDIGPSIEGTDPEDSELYLRIILPADDPGRMPAEGKMLSKEQTDLIRKWIEQGASWPDELELKAVRPSDPSEDLPEFAREPLTDEERELVAKIREQGGHVMELAQNDHRIEVAFHLADGSVTDERLAALKGFKRIVHLNLRGTEITDEGLAHLSELENLTRLHLERTGITDKGLEHLKGLASLQYLNLYGTKVTDEGLEQLRELANLRKIYLWETEVTDAGAEKLKESLPELEIVRGVDLAQAEEESEEGEKGQDEKDEGEKEEKED